MSTRSGARREPGTTTPISIMTSTSDCTTLLHLYIFNPISLSTFLLFYGNS